MTAAYDYVMSRGGMNSDSMYSYEGDDDNSCRFRNNAKVNFEVTGYQYTIEGDEKDLQIALLQSSPVIVAIL